METIKSILDFVIFSYGDFNIKVKKVIIVLFILLLTHVFLWLVKKGIYKRFQEGKVDEGNTFALFQIIKYLVWIIAFVFLLESLGVKITLLLAGSAALLVGIGLGLQQTFNDIISGVILLSERSIKIGDVLEIDGDIVKIHDIGIRTSKGSNRDDISIIIPNSLIATSKVINWSHQTKKTRFKIDVGVAYGSDVDLVIKILEESAIEHPQISNRELIDARLINFGNSSLDFQLFFFSKNIFRIEKVKSDIRIIIHRKFNENNILIPFPQMDIHVKPNDINKA
ncbi:MAG: mechanosensitive ion channel [Flavobacteriales bacterium]|nr:mechanosensitive ion channel [Flavobacteriia bacterium]NCP06410.1 mechanosensitive ion channel [Flavobacteriales bacterium]PIV94926.1 MAG: mechanosensitive ion channel protein MscS [Flavobacteriaceae bacterium CG17_big_fil_post_rev_8_21_14_2_50_33_15]PIY09558.1 MAG: mechanosensitive ion channel protein MscS [Flavobacteriaceae bacterium CG_4_10_14_3_um_filter_33_47]PJB17509.1 MAG: mechanosensitive ion channel protein MscS [Flavobacteriaceae bacterium CG_4_9_14_3_um_filter_33_16]